MEAGEPCSALESLSEVSSTFLWFMINSGCTAAGPLLVLPLWGWLIMSLFISPQLSHPVEICEQGPEANERLPGGERRDGHNDGDTALKASRAQLML